MREGGRIEGIRVGRRMTMLLPTFHFPCTFAYVYNMKHLKKISFFPANRCTDGDVIMLLLHYKFWWSLGSLSTRTENEVL